MAPITLPKDATKCAECQKSQTLLWRPTKEGHFCQECFERRESVVNVEEDMETEDKPLNGRSNKDQKDAKEIPDTKSEASASTRMLRKSTRARTSARSTRFKTVKPAAAVAVANPNNNNTSSKAQTKGRSRRSLYKKTPLKTPVWSQASTRFVQSVFFKGSYMQVGDIVSLADTEGSIYYAQIRGLLVDLYCEKSAFLTWLIPTQSSPDPNEVFDPSTYIIGPDEEQSRKLSCLEFIMHAPSDYYHDRKTPFPPQDTLDADTKTSGFIWTALPEHQRNRTKNLKTNPKVNKV